MASPRQGRQPQPTVFAEIDRSNAITKDIRDCVNFGPTGLPYNAGNRKLGSFTGAPSRSARRWGAGWLSATGKYPRVPRVAGLIGARDVTIRCVWVQDSLTSYVVPFSCGAESVYNAAGATFISVDASGNLDSYCRLGGVAFGVGTLGVTAGTLNDFVLRRNWRAADGVSSVIELFLNGVLKFTYGTGGGSAGSTEATADWIFGKAESFTDLPGTVLQFQTWARGLTNGEINSLNSDKWQLFEPIRRAVFFAPAAAAGGQSITVPAAPVTVAASAPTVSRTTNTNSVAITVPEAPVTVAANAPTVSRTTNTNSVAITVPAAAVTVAANAPTVSQAAPGTTLVTVPTAPVTVAGVAPTVSRTTNTNAVAITTPAAAVTVAANAPIVTRTALNYISVPVANVNVLALAPTITVSGIVLPPAALAQMYGGGAMYPRKKKKKKEEPTIEEMVEAVAEEPKGKEKIVALLPKKVRQELPDDMWEVSVDKLVKEVKDASDRVQKGVERLYEKRRQKDDDEAFMLLNL